MKPRHRSVVVNLIFSLPPPPAAFGRDERVILPHLIAQAEWDAWALGHDVTLERENRYEAVGWCAVCGWAATVDLMPAPGEAIFGGSCLDMSCAGEKVPPPWA